jgi:hypothetical protein
MKKDFDMAIVEQKKKRESFRLSRSGNTMLIEWLRAPEFMDTTSCYLTEPAIELEYLTTWLL